MSFWTPFSWNFNYFSTVIYLGRFWSFRHHFSLFEILLQYKSKMHQLNMQLINSTFNFTAASLQQVVEKNSCNMTYFPPMNLQLSFLWEIQIWTILFSSNRNWKDVGGPMTKYLIILSIKDYLLCLSYLCISLLFFGSDLRRKQTKKREKIIDRSTIAVYLLWIDSLFVSRTEIQLTHEFPL